MTAHKNHVTPEPAGDGAIGIVVVNYGSHALIDTNLRPDLSTLNARVVIVDNYSDDAEAQAVDALADRPGWSVIRLPENLGFGSAVDLGLAEAARLGCRCFLVLNPDAIVTDEVVEALRAQCVQTPLTLVTPRLVRSDGSVYFQGSEVDWRTGRIRGLAAPPAPTATDAALISRIDGPAQRWLTGACIAFHDDLRQLIGGLRGPYFLYWEDVDLSYRVEQAGGSLLIRMDLTATHDEGGTQQRRRAEAKSDIYYFYNCRNRLVFGAAHLPRRELLRWMASTPAVSWEIVKRGGRRQLLDSPRPLLAAVRGSLAGLLVAGRVLLSTGDQSRPGFSVSAPVAARSAAAHPAMVHAGSAGGVSGTDTISVTIAVLTFRRPVDLQLLLPMLVDQLDTVQDAGYSVEVLVTDNDPKGSARATVGDLDLTGVRYVNEPMAGISAARNRALAESAADLLIFIDDDEQPSPAWLSAMLDTWRRTGAVAVAGTVVSEFDGVLDPWIQAGGFFRRRRLPTGTPIDVAATNNLLLDRRQLAPLNLRFDGKFGLSGGEDTLFTRTIHANGLPMVWCSEAFVTDQVPRNRMTRRWVLARAMSSGNAWCRVDLTLATNWRERATARARALARGGVRVVGGSAKYLLGVVTRADRHQAGGLRTIARGVGMMSAAVGFLYKEYRRPA